MNKQPIVLFRVFTSLIFIFGGVTHLAGAGKVFKKATSSTLYAYLDNDLLFMVAIYVTGGIMLGAGLFLMSGYRQRKAALLLLGVLIRSL